jgi:WNK lysine deficient protein kinase
VRTIDFVFDPDVDTADNLAGEISEEFALSPTDTEICAAALRELLAKDMPGSDTK